MVFNVVAARRLLRCCLAVARVFLVVAKVFRSSY